MICPRCADEQIEVMAKSPVKDVWQRQISASIAFIPGDRPNRCAVPAANIIPKRSA